VAAVGVVAVGKKGKGVYARVGKKPDGGAVGKKGKGRVAMDAN
jgi:hypothetical protein